MYGIPGRVSNNRMISSLATLRRLVVLVDHCKSNFKSIRIRANRVCLIWSALFAHQDSVVMHVCYTPIAIV